MKLSYLGVFAAIGSMLVLGEVGLEVRAHRRGFDTLLLGAPEAPRAASGSGEGVRWGPTTDFPFRSAVATRDGMADHVRIWFASSSYGEDVRYAPDEVFPNLVAGLLRDSLGIPATSLNRSAAGLLIPDNVRHLDQEAQRWSPDVVVLYQMTNDLNQLAEPGFDPTADRPAGVDRRPRWWQVGRRLERTWERTTLFAQLRANVTPHLTRQRILPDTLTLMADSVFRARVESFVETAREVGAMPVLVTFAPRESGSAPPSRESATWMLRWNPNQSPEGYLRTVREWNDTVRAVARERDVLLVDLERAIDSRPELYRDVAHFTREGHGVVARVLADALGSALVGRR